jgi:pilus assembly protein CpaC
VGLSFLAQDPPRRNDAGNSSGGDGNGRLIRDQTKQAINGLPGLSLPVLGTPIPQPDFINSQSELMVMVTPFIVRAVAQRTCRGWMICRRFRPAGRSAGQHQPHLRRAGRVEPAQNYRGTYGFITD